MSECRWCGVSLRGGTECDPHDTWCGGAVFGGAFWKFYEWCKARERAKGKR